MWAMSKGIPADIQAIDCFQFNENAIACAGMQSVPKDIPKNALSSGYTICPFSMLTCFEIKTVITQKSG